MSVPWQSHGTMSLWQQDSMHVFHENVDRVKICRVKSIVGGGGNGGKPFSTAGDHFPWWENISHGWISCLPSLQISIKGRWPMGRPSFVEAAEGHIPYRWVSGGYASKQQISPWKIVSHRGRGSRTAENGFPVGRHFPTWELTSYRFRMIC